MTICNYSPTPQIHYFYGEKIVWPWRHKTLHKGASTNNAVLKGKGKKVPEKEHSLTCKDCFKLRGDDVKTFFRQEYTVKNIFPLSELLILLLVRWAIFVTFFMILNSRKGICDQIWQLNHSNWTNYHVIWNFHIFWENSCNKKEWNSSVV